MKAIQTRQTRTVNSQEFEQGKFKLNAEDAQLFKILRSQIYENKILAVVREYSCNALDAHVEAGISDKPIEITLPKSEFDLLKEIDSKELFITSNVIHNISKENDISVTVKKAKGTKCSRCWKIVKEVKEGKCSRCYSIK